jgi:alkylation response protein AidB-like acyl-CoA dehydrogenase
MSTQYLEAARDLRATIDRNASRAGKDPILPETIAALSDAGLFGVMTPKDVGGAELPILDAIDVFAEVSRADGSTGWCLMAGACTVAYFAAYGAADFVDQLFARGIPIAAGQFAPNGTAVPVDGGYRVSGSYQFGSGINHAAWVGAGVMTKPPEGSEENPDLLFTLFPKREVELRGNWDVLGLESTASWDYVVEDVAVPAGATFQFFTPTRHRGGPLYELGVIPLTAAGHAGFAIGVVRRALDELLAIAKTKHRMGGAAALRDSELFLHTLGTLESRFRSAVAWVRETFAQAERTVVETGTANPFEMNQVRQATVHVTQEGAAVTRDAYLLAGTTALRDGPMQRCFRDIHAGSQHFFASPASTLDMGRDLMASAPDSALEA